MDTLQRKTRHLQDNESDDRAALYLLIQRSLDALLHGNTIEGISTLVQALAWISEKTPMAHLLESAIEACERYNQAQERLLNASRDYVKAEAERQAQLDVLAEALLTGGEQHTALLSTLVPLHRYFAQEQVERRSISSTSGVASNSPVSLFIDETQSDSLPALSITCFGQFTVSRGGRLLELCHSRSGQAILRYLVAQPGYRATADTLMGVLWPDEEPAVARRRLQVAISSLRSSLNQGYNCDPGSGYIVFRNQVYQINPSITLQTDVEEFLALYRAGQTADQQKRILSYEHACRLYHGSFLVEDLYEDWSMRGREQLSQEYLTMCSVLCNYFFEAGHYEDAAHWARAILDKNRCDEEAHRQLIRTYAAQGRRNDALRQYHMCEQALMEELGVTPMAETVQLQQEILLRPHGQVIAER